MDKSEIQATPNPKAPSKEGFTVYFAPSHHTVMACNDPIMSVLGAGSATRYCTSAGEWLEPVVLQCHSLEFTTIQEDVSNTMIC